ncbi:hypothetical protein [Mucilaginibacter gotjawali]|uniref:Uncharacterized protein n=2 Tax=Mucilaginibacter gotjawali TaxID=1550579 RepID=A0A0X8X0M7_9SPHI|nr:hypothetical protein [Mucilaginibacter gotjawali]MBB3056025.1 hypothetical protein [Mucilaginibacter gotjawali]BAU53639.1 hypothetical protein MgSA37_01808 [Mucilaginibacter gotjawali]
MKKITYGVTIYGILSESSKKIVYKGLERNANESLSLNLFCSYSEFQIPIGATFNYFEKGDLKLYLNPEAILVDVTQQFGKPFPAIPTGWKTISKFTFSEKDIIILKNELPVIDSWELSDCKANLSKFE